MVDEHHRLIVSVLSLGCVFSPWFPGLGIHEFGELDRGRSTHIR
jgi:hypothetical protein